MFDFQKKINFVKAKHFTTIDEKHPRHINLIVIHTMEASEKPDTAEAVAKYFSRMDDGRVASAHYCIDADSIVQCVQCKDVAFGAPNANKNGIHLEHAGYAKQTRGDWNDPYSIEMQKNSAKLAATVLCPKYGIDFKFLSLEEIVAMRKDKNISGFCTHADVTNAFNNPGGHMDPGVGFDKNYYIELVKRASQGRF